ASYPTSDLVKPDECGIDVRLFYDVFDCTRCASHATTQTCPRDTKYRLNISGTGIRDMLRHGILPPKEVVRPASARIAIQGVQPKGINNDGHGTLPVSKDVQSMFPYYTEHTRLGG